MPQPQLRRRLTDSNTGDSFDVVYRDARMVVSDGLREAAIVPASRMAEDGYRLDLNERVQSLARRYIFATPRAALAGAVEHLSTMSPVWTSQREREEERPKIRGPGAFCKGLS